MALSKSVIPYDVEGNLPRVFVAVSDKSNRWYVVDEINRLGYTDLAPRNAATTFDDAGIYATTVKELTNLPGLLGGGEETLHPNKDGGILARRKGQYIEILEKYPYGFRRWSGPYDHIVIANLYDKVSSSPGGVSFDKDIGGSTMIGEAAKVLPPLRSQMAAPEPKTP